MANRVDTIVLGAGIIGISAAIHLARRGRETLLVDRQLPGEATSYGNSGLIQMEGIFPRPFPRNILELLGDASNLATRSHYHLRDLPGLAPFLARYWWHSAPVRYAEIAKRYAPLILRSVEEHADLIEAAGAGDLIRKDGWIEMYRSRRAADAAARTADTLKREYGVKSEVLDHAGLKKLEPAIRVEMAGAVHWHDPWTVREPVALSRAYLALFEKLGGRFATGDGMSLSRSGNHWTVETYDGPVTAREVVIAMGPWAMDLTQKLGYRLPLAGKRGYHMHFAPVPGEELNHCTLDAEGGYMLAPQRQGIRLTTGAEFARRDAPHTPVQLARATRIARKLIPLGDERDAKPWMGVRPCTPDMLPIIGPAPSHEGLWFDFGHAHHGLTLGPVSGRLVAEVITGETPVIDPTAFSAERFG